MERTPIEEGIKKIGVGKNTTKVCESDLVDKILLQLKDGTLDLVQRATFLTALKVKGADGDEERVVALFNEAYKSNESFIKFIAPEISDETLKLVERCFEKGSLSVEEARALGAGLMSDKFSSPLKVLIAVVLRMKHASVDEYEGLLQAIEETFKKSFVAGDVHSEKPIVQISEPFDGFNRGHLISPLYAYYLKNSGFTPVQNSGNSSGPKFGNNSKSMKGFLDLNVLESSKDLWTKDSRFGGFLEQENLSKPLCEWQSLRKKMLKRPFLATLEKYVNPFSADMLVCSSFHNTFFDKGLELAKRAGFKSCINIIRGLEGGCGLSLKRKTKVTMFVQRDGHCDDYEFEFQPEDFGITAVNDRLDRDVTAKDNADLINTFTQNKQSSGDDYFDLRANYSLKVIEFLVSKAFPEKTVDFFNIKDK